MISKFIPSPNIIVLKSNNLVTLDITSDHCSILALVERYSTERLASVPGIKLIKNSRIAQESHKKAIDDFNSVQNKLIKSKDFKEGLKSFMEKREPNFRK